MRVALRAVLILCTQFHSTGMARNVNGKTIWLGPDGRKTTDKRTRRSRLLVVVAVAVGSGSGCVSTDRVVESLKIGE